MVGNGLVPYDDLYHEYPERHEQMKYMAAAPNKECESVTFDSALSFGKMYVDPLASVYPSQLKKDSPQSDIKKQTFVPVRLRSRGGRCARGRGRGHGRVLVGFSVRACSFCYTLVIGGREKTTTVEPFPPVARGFCEGILRAGLQDSFYPGGTPSHTRRDASDHKIPYTSGSATVAGTATGKKEGSDPPTPHRTAKISRTDKKQGGNSGTFAYRRAGVRQFR